MTVLGEKKLSRFSRDHAAARKPLTRFLDLARAADWKHLADLKSTFPDADYTPGSEVVVFNIGGNNFRLVATVNYELDTLLIEEVLTHAEYDKRRY